MVWSQRTNKICTNINKFTVMHVVNNVTVIQIALLLTNLMFYKSFASYKRAKNSLKKMHSIWNRTQYADS